MQMRCGRPGRRRISSSRDDVQIGGGVDLVSRVDRASPRSVADVEALGGGEGCRDLRPRMITIFEVRWWGRAQLSSDRADGRKWGSVIAEGALERALAMRRFTDARMQIQAMTTPMAMAMAMTTTRRARRDPRTADDPRKILRCLALAWIVRSVALPLPCPTIFRTSSGHPVTTTQTVSMVSIVGCSPGFVTKLHSLGCATHPLAGHQLTPTHGWHRCRPTLGPSTPPSDPGDFPVPRRGYELI